MEINPSKSLVLAVDWGTKRLGLAISDPTRTLARPLCVVEHISRSEDASRILAIVEENNVGLIVIGINYDDQPEPTYSGRSAMRLLKEIQGMTSIGLITWNETGSTRAAIASRLELGVVRKKRKGHHDALAAAFILQDFLDIGLINYENKKP
ncbi:MAG: Holliday junction resolvase RuvX [Pelolinea sp.]|nr:Holliday junction resolvase RuvX [Pelolinea sp.]